MHGKVPVSAICRYGIGMNTTRTLANIMLARMISRPSWLRATCLCAFALLLAVNTASATDLFIKNINGYTLDAKGELQRFEAMHVVDGKVFATGSARALAPRARDAVVLDGEGKTLLPGLIDAHGHIMGLGAMQRSINLTDTKTLEEAFAQIAAYAERNPQAKWLLGGGWNQVIWKLGRFPNAKELDGAVASRPAWLERIDGHAGWANAEAMKRAGISAATLDPDGGRIERDEKGNPTGIFVDAAMALISKHIPPPDEAESMEMLDAALKTLASVGLTSVHDAGVDAATIGLYRHYAVSGKLTTRIYAMVAGTGADFDTVSRFGPVLGYGNDWLTVRSVKLMIDGALGSRGAALIEPYSDAPDQRGLMMASVQELADAMLKAFALGYQVNIHAIGDAGNRAALDAFSLAYANKRVVGGRDRRNRIEHAQVVALEDIPRFLPLNLIASMQPTHATSDMNMAEDRVGAERIKGAYAWQAFLKQGTVLAAGSDFPVESPNPFYGLHAAVTRQDHHNQPAEGWYPQQRLTLEQALRAFTLDAAYAAHQEHALGTLEKGKWADFILIDRDIFATPVETLWQTQVLKTFAAGVQVYPSKDAQGP